MTNPVDDDGTVVSRSYELRQSHCAVSGTFLLPRPLSRIGFSRQINSIRRIRSFLSFLHIFELAPTPALDEVLI